jgi:hypothetical protein
MPNHCMNTLVMSETTLPVILSKYVRKADFPGFPFRRACQAGE